LVGSVLTIKKNLEVLVVARKEIRIEVNADKTSRAEYRAKSQYGD
jgi:hypothetical protein